MTEQFRLPIEQKRIDKGERKIKKRLSSFGFSVGNSCQIPEDSVYTFLPVVKDKAEKNLSNILNTSDVMKEWDEGATGMITGIGLGLKKLQDATMDNSKIYDFGSWDYLFGLGRKANISEFEIKKAVIQFALDQSNISAKNTLDLLTTKASIPEWIDQSKSTPIELLAASYATDNKELAPKLKRYSDKRGSVDISTVASVQKKDASISINIPFKPWKWIIPILKSLHTIDISHEIAHKMMMSVIDSAKGIYKSGLFRNTKKESSIYSIIQEAVGKKPQG